MNEGFTQILALILSGLLAWAAIVDLRTRTIPDWLNIVVAVMAPLFWWASGIPFYPDAVERICGAFPRTRRRSIARACPGSARRAQRGRGALAGIPR